MGKTADTYNFRGQHSDIKMFTGGFNTKAAVQVNPQIRPPFSFTMADIEWLNLFLTPFPELTIDINVICVYSVVK